MLSRREADRLADDMHVDRMILRSLYCGRCGYNLRTLPYIYRCPECGNEYNARNLSMKGIYRPNEVEIPFGDFGLFLFSGAVCAYMVGWIIASQSIVAFAFAAFFLYTAARHLMRTYQKLVAFVRGKAIEKRIAEQEEDE